jgi:nicotinic acid mononucleotide adenylyltransferase
VFLPGAFAGSSTEARRRVAAKESTTGLLPEAVAEFIKRHRLYGSAP